MLDGEGRPLPVIESDVIGFASTQVKKYKRLMMTLPSLIGDPPVMPLFAYRWRLRTQPEQNSKGKFFGWRIDLDAETAAEARLNPGDPGTGEGADPLYRRAKELYALLREGAARADFTTAAQEDADLAEGGEAQPTDDEIPMS